MSGFYYTGKGDKGQSNVGGKKIDKTAPEIKAVGMLDETNSLLGLVKIKDLPDTFPQIIQDIQENLFIIQAHIGCYMMGEGNTPPEFSEQKISDVEQLIEELEQKVSPDRGFIVSGSNEISAWLDYARTVARRAEIATLKLRNEARDYTFAPELFAYLNRLSSLLYAMARFAAKSEDVKEKHPDY